LPHGVEVAFAKSDGLGEAERSKSLRPTGSGSASLPEQST